MSGESSGLSRRRFLVAVGGVGVVAVTGGLSACGRSSGEPLLSGPGQVLPSKRPLPEPFRVQLPMPPVAKPVRSDADADYYELVQRPADVELLPGVKTTVWGFDGRFPGPTFHARSGRKSIVTVRNELPVPTSTHLHGGVTEPESDGYPTDLVTPRGFSRHVLMHGHHGGEPMAKPSDYILHNLSKDHEYTLQQRAATLWYHDHRMDFSAPQVWRGLAGMFILRDDEEDALPLPSGAKDVPLLICDRSFNQDGSFRYPSVDSSLLGAPGVEDDYMDGVLGDVLLVNGAPWPVMDVSNTRYRLRFLNACNARRLRLKLDPEPRDGGDPFSQIGSDIGLLEKPQELSRLDTSPAERYDLIVDFSRYPVGTEVTLVNEFGHGGTERVMKFRVTRRESDSSAIPDTLASYEKLRRSQAVNTRTFDFRRAPAGQPFDWTINGKGFDPAHIEAEPQADSVELWKFTSDFHHPVHTHLGHFQVLSRGGGEVEPQDAGWKDTVDVRPYGVVEVLMKFPRYRGRYMIHCHNLEHEDMAMMVNFKTV